MSIKNQIKRLLKNPRLILVKLDTMKLIKLSDKKYLEILFKDKLGYALDLNNPKTYNEKMQWLKLYDRNPKYSKLVDKYEVKKYIKDKIGEKYLIKTLGIYNNFDEIDFESLPNQFVIKCTHDSGGLVIVKDKSSFNINDARKRINKCLKMDFYRLGREFAYKDVSPRIIIEEYMEDKKNTLNDYKFFCFDGVPKIMYVSSDSHTDNQKIAFFDMEYKQIDIKRDDYNDYDVLPSKPKTFEEMKKIARILSKDIPHVRVDLYEINGKVYFGELTFYTCSGYMPFKDKKWDLELGKFVKINSK